MRAVVTGVGHYLPEKVVSSREVEERVAELNGFTMPPGMIELLSGVKSRHYAPEDAASSDLAAAAGKIALENAGVHPMGLDMMISSSATHDCAEPSTACIVQSKVGCKSAQTMDVKDACNGFLHGLDVAASMIETGRATKILVTAGEVLSSVIDWRIDGMADLQTKFAGLTLGDAGAAFVVEASEDSEDAERGILQGEFMTDGDHWRLSTVLGGGTLMRQSAEGAYFDCRSAELAQLALDHLPDLFAKGRDRLGWTPEDIALAVPHQVSRGVAIELAGRWDFPIDRCMITLDRVGNTAAASIPLAVSMAVEEGRLKQGDKVLLIGGAAGFSGGLLPLIW